MITVATETKNNVSNFQEIQESDYLFVFIFHHLKSTKGEKKTTLNKVLPPTKLTNGHRSLQNSWNKSVRQ